MKKMAEHPFGKMKKTHKFLDWLEDLDIDWGKFCCCIVILAFAIPLAYYGISYGIEVKNRDDLQFQYNDTHPYVQGKITSMTVQQNDHSDEYSIQILNKTYPVSTALYYDVNVGECIALYDHNFNVTAGHSWYYTETSYKLINCSVCGC